MISTQAEMYDCVYFVRRQGMGGFHRQVTLAGDLRAGCLNVANGAWTQGGKILGTDKMGSGHKLRRRKLGTEAIRPKLCGKISGGKDERSILPEDHSIPILLIVNIFRPVWFLAIFN